MTKQAIPQVKYKGFTITANSRGIGYDAVNDEDPALRQYSLTWCGLIRAIHALLWPEIVPVDSVLANSLAETFRGYSSHIDHDLNNNKREY